MALISEEDKELRAEIVRESIYSVELEGLTVDEDVRKDFDRYIEGEISLADISALMKARYGIN